MDVLRDKSRKERVSPESSGSEKAKASPRIKSTSPSGEALSPHGDSASLSAAAHSDPDARSLCDALAVNEKRPGTATELVSNALQRLIGRSGQMRHIHELVKKVALCDTTILIEAKLAQERNWLRRPYINWGGVVPAIFLLTTVERLRIL